MDLQFYEEKKINPGSAVSKSSKHSLIVQKYTRMVGNKKY